MRNENVVASFRNDEDSVPFNRVYKNKKSFLAGIKRMQGATLINAVDNKALVVIYPSNLEEYKNNKKV